MANLSVLVHDDMALVVAQDDNNDLRYHWAKISVKFNMTRIAPAGAAVSAPAFAVRSNNQVIVAIESPTHTLVIYSLTPGIFAPEPSQSFAPEPSSIPLSAYSAPAIWARSNGEVDLVTQGPDNSLIYYRSGSPGNWDTPQTIAGAHTSYSDPAIAVTESGEMYVAVQGPNRQLFCWTSMSGSSWVCQTVAGPDSTSSSPAIGSRATGEVDVVAQGPDGKITHYSQVPLSFHARAEAFEVTNWVGKPSGTVKLPTPVWKPQSVALAFPLSRPAMFVSPTGEIYLAYLDPAHVLMYARLSPGSETWQPPLVVESSVTVVSSLGIFVRSTGEVDIVGQALDNRNFYIWGTSGASSFTPEALPAHPLD